MFKQKPFPFSFLVLAVLITLHSIGSYYYLYWRFPWYDSLVHIVSGLWVALLILWLASVLGQVNSLKEYKFRSFLIAVISAVFIGIIWELIENYYQVTYTNAGGYYLDTAMDLLSDGLGGILAYLYFIKKTKCIMHDPEILHPFYNQIGLIKN